MLSTRIRSAHRGSAVSRKDIAMTMIGIDLHKATHDGGTDESSVCMLRHWGDAGA